MPSSRAERKLVRLRDRRTNSQSPRGNACENFEPKTSVESWHEADEAIIIWAIARVDERVDGKRRSCWTIIWIPVCIRYRTCCRIRRPNVVTWILNDNRVVTTRNHIRQSQCVT